MRRFLEQLGRNPDAIAVALICATLVPMPKIAGVLIPRPAPAVIVWSAASAEKLQAQAMRDALTAREQALVLMEKLRAESAACDREGNGNDKQDE
jgi:hypothetical protein